ncbi:hypothetical protein MINS_12000 [Mycolicibacterium insubricum]|nr:hypothetical protein MINS_12000 [Mycolicibacterium insubricum]
MPWEPENFAPAERKAAGSAVVQAQVVVYKLRVNASEFGAEHAAAVTGAYLRVGDMLDMLYHDIYGLDGTGSVIPQPPSAS